MKDASAILFEEFYDGKPLFKNQFDLVTQLLNDKNNPYYIDISDLDQYTKAQTRLKTYISQLLSASATRSITEDFKTGLISIFKKKLDPKIYDADEIVVALIDILRIKNSRISRAESKNTVRDQLTFDLNGASYIAVITSKPLETDIQEDTNYFSLRNFLFKDLLDRLCDTNKHLKMYRFNFPMDTYCFLFWRGLKKILMTHITKNISPELVETLYDKFAIYDSTFSKMEYKTQYTKEDITRIVDETLKKLNTNRHIVVCNNSAPIYGMPLIALNPSDPRNIKVYSLLQDEEEAINIFKFSGRDSILWRVFVWDKLKAKKVAGEEIIYSDDI